MKHLISHGYFLLAFFAFTLNNIHAGHPPFLQENSGIKVQSKPEQLKNIHYKVIRAAGESFGYDIYVDGKLFIRQLTIPGMPGNEGFKSKEAAQKIAQLVKDKLSKGEIPPTVSNAELKKLKAI